MKTLVLAAAGLTGLVGSRIKELTDDIFRWHNFSPSNNCNLIDYRQVEKSFSQVNTDIFINFSAFTNVQQAEKQKGNTQASCYQLNVVLPQNLARASKKFNRHLIHFSTDAVFDGQKHQPYCETDPPNPIHWYGQTKYLGEIEIQKSACSFSIIRIAYPFRAHFSPKTDIVRKTINNLSSGQQTTMFTDTAITPTFIDDIAPAVKTVILEKPQGLFHFVGSTIVSPYNLAKNTAQIFHLNQNLILPDTLSAYLKTSNLLYPQYAGMSNQKAKQKLKTHFHTFPEALKIIKSQLRLKPS